MIKSKQASDLVRFVLQHFRKVILASRWRMDWMKTRLEVTGLEAVLEFLVGGEVEDGEGTQSAALLFVMEKSDNQMSFITGWM